MKNLGKYHENEDNEEFIENNSDINDSIKSKISKGITKEDVIISLVYKNFLLKLIKVVILSIDTYKQDVLSVSNEKKKSPSQRQMESL